MSTEPFPCRDKALQNNHLNSSNVERLVVSTYGSFLATSLADWSKQIVQLGRVILLVNVIDCESKCLSFIEKYLHFYWLLVRGEKQKLQK